MSIKQFGDNQLGDNQLVPDSLEAAAYCPLCETRQKGFSNQILAESPTARLIHTHCHGCGSFIVSVILANSMGISSIGLVTDLTSEDVLKFKDGAAITYDDVLTFYEKY